MSVCYTRAYNLLRSAASQQAFDLSREPDRVRDRFGRNRLGQSVLAARRLVEAGIRLVLVADTTENTNGKWDTHSGYAKDLHLRIRESDQALSALLDDLSVRGLLDTTIVAWMGEFGRTPRVKPDGGRDHWPACYSASLPAEAFKEDECLGRPIRWVPTHATAECGPKTSSRRSTICSACLRPRKSTTRSAGRIGSGREA